MKVFKKICCIALAASIAVAFTACGSSGGNSSSTAEKTSKPKKQATQKLVIKDSGYKIREEGKDDFVYYGIKIYNPNETKQVELPTITITGYDSNGKVTGTEDQTIDTIYPKQNAYFGFMASLSKGTKKVKFTISAGSDSYTTISAAEAKEKSNQFEFSGVHSNNSTFPTVTGTVKNKGKDISELMVAAVFLNKGKIVYGDCTYVENIAKGQSKPFEITLTSGEIPDHDKIITFAQNWA